ncbi:MAG: hypothetical protein PHE89_06030 [Alphaproteobacteria bacterium]|nr:hypothetical protein [Alphaproteobacteria bacterium]
MERYCYSDSLFDCHASLAMTMDVECSIISRFVRNGIDGFEDI